MELLFIILVVLASLGAAVLMWLSHPIPNLGWPLLVVLGLPALIDLYRYIHMRAAVIILSRIRAVLGTGMPLEPALASMRVGSNSLSVLQRKLGALYQCLIGHIPLPQALRVSKVLPADRAARLEVASLAGRMPEALGVQIKELRTGIRRSTRWLAWLIYPLLIGIVTLILVWYISIRLFPILLEVGLDFEIESWIDERWMANTQLFTIALSLVYVVGMGLPLLAWFTGRRIFPVFGLVAQLGDRVAALRTMADAMRAELPAPLMLELCSRAVRLDRTQQRFGEALRMVNQGVPLPEALRQTRALSDNQTEALRAALHRGDGATTAEMLADAEQARIDRRYRLAGVVIVPAWVLAAAVPVYYLAVGVFANLSSWIAAIAARK